MPLALKHESAARTPMQRVLTWEQVAATLPAAALCPPAAWQPALAAAAGPETRERLGVQAAARQGARPAAWPAAHLLGCWACPDRARWPAEELSCELLKWVHRFCVFGGAREAECVSACGDVSTARSTACQGRPLLWRACSQRLHSACRLRGHASLCTPGVPGTSRQASRRCQSSVGCWSASALAAEGCLAVQQPAQRRA